MNTSRLFKKDSAIIARLAVRAGFIKPKLFNNLYWAEFHRKSNKKRKRGKGSRLQYYTELHYSTSDYWGEWDEHSLISFIFDCYYWDMVEIEGETGHFTPPKKVRLSNKSIIKRLRDDIQQNKLHRTKAKHLPFNRIKTHRKRSRRNKILRNRKHYH